MPVIIRNSGGVGYSSAPNLEMKSGSTTSAEKISFSFKEVDFISNDSDENDLTVKFYKSDGAEEAGSITLKPGESINDLHFSGGAIEFSGTGISSRYMLLG